jgi:tetratricopeptide (TPR) repeat protein
MRILYLVFFLFLSSSAPVGAQPDPKEMLQKTYESGVVAYQEGRYQEAIELMEKALNIYPNFPAAYNYIGLSRKELKQDIKEVQWLFKKAIEINPQYAPAYENLAKLHYELAQFDEAEMYGLKAIEVDPESMTAHLALGWIYLLGKSQPHEAVYYFNKVIQNQDLPFVQLGLGMAYFMSGEDHKALEMITLLRKRGHEDFAMELERMVRDKRYIPPIKGWSSEEKESQALAPKEILPPVPVRLRGKINTETSVVETTPAKVDTAPYEELEEEQAVNGKERLRQLQKKRVSEYIRDY